MRFPKTLKIGGVRYQVTRRPAKESNLGMCFVTRGKININPVACKDMQRATLLHEAFHAALFDAGVAFSKQSDEERLVNPLAARIDAMLRDNPSFLALYK